MRRSVGRGFDRPDEQRGFPGGVLDLISIGPLTFGRETLEPGWRWSKDVGPIAGTERCEHHHVGYQLSGRWICEDRDGTQVEIGPGDIYDTPPGHDSWVVGDEPSVSIDFQGVADWALRGSPERSVVTVVFADVVESTALIGRIGDHAWRRLQARHLESVHALLGEHGGTLVDVAGDGILGRFASPARAVRFAGALVATAAHIGIEIRAGVHTGEVEATPSGIGGMAVHVGARVMGQAGPGEVVVSSTTRDLTMDAGLRYALRGAVELKGVDGARTLYVLEG